MKRILFVLPLCILLADCSSSRKAVVPASPGISNVNVSANGSASTAVNTSAAISPENRDWAYKAKYENTLDGNWALQGMLGTTGWTSTAQDTAAAATAATTTDAQGTGTTGSIGAAGSTSTDNSINSSAISGASSTDAASMSSTTTGAKTKTKAKNSRAVYDSAQARLNYNVQSAPSVIDSSLLQPYKYWGRTPSIVINTTSRVFSGTTGCNSMSGSFNISGNDIRFGRTISTSKMSCNDYDETAFVNTLKKVDNYVLNGNHLELRQGSTLLLSFAKK